MVRRSTIAAGWMQGGLLVSFGLGCAQLAGIGDTEVTNDGSGGSTATQGGAGTVAGVNQSYCSEVFDDIPRDYKAYAFGFRCCSG